MFNSPVTSWTGSQRASFHLNPDRELRRALLDGVFFNHQRYSVSFSEGCGGVLKGRVQREGLLFEDVPIYFAQNQSFFNLRSPKEITFYPEKRAIVVGTYGLKGGMKMGKSLTDSIDEELVQKGGIELRFFFEHLLNFHSAKERMRLEEDNARRHLNHQDENIHLKADSLINEIQNADRLVDELSERASAFLQRFSDILHRIVYLNKKMQSDFLYRSLDPKSRPQIFEIKDQISGFHQNLIQIKSELEYLKGKLRWLRELTIRFNASNASLGIMNPIAQQKLDSESYSRSLLCTDICPFPSFDDFNFEHLVQAIGLLLSLIVHGSSELEETVALLDGESKTQKNLVKIQWKIFISTWDRLNRNISILSAYCPKEKEGGALFY